MQPAGESSLFTGPSFVADVDPAGGVVADQHRGQSRAKAIALREGSGRGGRFRLHGLRQLLAVENNSGHAHLSVRNSPVSSRPRLAKAARTSGRNMTTKSTTAKAMLNRSTTMPTMVWKTAPPETSGVPGGAFLMNSLVQR